MATDKSCVDACSPPGNELVHSLKRDGQDGV